MSIHNQAVFLFLDFVKNKCETFMIAPLFLVQKILWLLSMSFQSHMCSTKSSSVCKIFLYRKFEFFRDIMAPIFVTGYVNFTLKLILLL